MATTQIDALAALLREREARSLSLLLAIVVASFVAQAINLWLQYLIRPDVSGELREDAACHRRPLRC
jgi:hypothetical protein